MNPSSSLKARLVEILVALPPDERKIIAQELKEVVRMIASEGGFHLADPSKPFDRRDSQGGLMYWN
jgi:hypothetical protein